MKRKKWNFNAQAIISVTCKYGFLEELRIFTSNFFRTGRMHNKKLEAFQCYALAENMDRQNKNQGGQFKQRTRRYDTVSRRWSFAVKRAN